MTNRMWVAQTMYIIIKFIYYTGFATWYCQHHRENVCICSTYSSLLDLRYLEYLCFVSVLYQTSTNVSKAVWYGL